MQNPKIFSFFSGSGILDLGFEMNGFDIEFVNEFCLSFLAAYKYSRSRMGLRQPTFGYWNTDINEYLAERSKELDTYIAKAHEDGSLVGFIGGPPCPDFSIAGKNRGREGDNGKLSLTYIKLIIAKQPEFFLFENVKGLWKTSRHRAFYEELKTILHDGGYCTTDRLTNALEFGVPQDRDRILLFGLNKRLLGNCSLDAFPWERYIKYDLKKIKSLSWLHTTPFSEDSTLDCPDGIPKELTVQYWFEKNGVNSHPNSNAFFVPRAGKAKMISVDEGDDSRKSYKRLHRWRYSPTVAYGNNEVHLHPYKARRLSASESMALQSLPREFELPQDMSLTDMFKTIGNGVPYLLACGIAKSIRDFLGEQVWEV